LQGAALTLARHKPVLAVSVSNGPADLWEIPQLIASIAPDYALYLRAHSDQGLDTVCYAVPKHRLLNA
jgi:hypothetical protein